MAPEAGRTAADEDLARHSGAGDRDAFAALYERHFDGLYDLAYRMVRTADAAADVAQETFVKAWDSFAGGKVPQNVKAWMYAVARNAAIDEIRRRGRELAEATHEGDDDAPPSALARLEAGPGADPVEIARDRELVELVWDSAAALNAKEYSVLDMHLRRGLTADDIAEHMEMSKGAVHTMLSRLRDSLEESVTSTLLARSGRRDCAELDAIVERTEPQGPRELRRAIRAHVDGCETCDASRRRLVSPSQLFAGIAILPAPVRLRDRVWRELSAHMDGRGRPSGRRPRRRAARAAAIAAALALIGGGSATALRAKSGLGVRDPALASSTHRPGVTSADNTIEVELRSIDPRAGAYSTLWTRDRSLEPDTVPESVDRAVVSPRLADGDWWLKVRTREAPGDGRWTATAEIGPFPIRDATKFGAPRLTCGALETIEAWKGRLRMDVTQVPGGKVEVVARPVGEGVEIWDRFLAGTELTLRFGERTLGSSVARPGTPFVVRASWPFGKGLLGLSHGPTRFAWRSCEHTREALPLIESPVGGFVSASSIAPVSSSSSARPIGWGAAAAGGLLLVAAALAGRRRGRA